MGNYDRYICTDLRKRHMLPGPTPPERDKLAAEGLRISMEHVLWIDDEVIPGAYYGETTWIWPPSYPNQISREELAQRTANARPMFPHVHDFPELLSWWGTDPDHPEDTSAMGMVMGNEEIPLPQSWVAYIPAGVKHMPTRPPGGRVAGIPICHWTSGPGAYTREADAKRAPIPAGTGAGGTGNGGSIVCGYTPHGKRPDYLVDTDPVYTRPMAWVDDVVVPGAEFGCDTRWLLPGDRSGAGQLMMTAHTLDHGVSLVFNAMNYEDITDLCAEVELWIGGEKYLVRRSFGAYIPPGVQQGPLIIRNITRQIFYMMSYPVGAGIAKYRGS
jgi:hypothetical protein